MTTKFLIAQSFGFLGIIVNVLSMHFKTRKNIFTMLFLLNLCSAFNFLFLDRTMSFLVELFGCVEITVNAQFEKRKKRVPIFVVVGYIACVSTLAALAMDSVTDLLLVIGASCYCLTLLIRAEQNIRKAWLVVMAFYLVYDLIVGAYVFAISNLITIISTLIAIRRYQSSERL